MSWFDRACRKKVDDALAEFQRNKINRVRQIEIKHLENPHVSLADLVAANGNILYAAQRQRSRAQSERLKQNIARVHTFLESFVKQSPSSDGHREQADEHTAASAGGVSDDRGVIDPATSGELGKSAREGARSDTESSSRKLPFRQRIAPTNPAGSTYAESSSHVNAAPNRTERKAAYHTFVETCKKADVKMNECGLAKLAKKSWNSRDPVAKWKQLKDRPGDDAAIRAAIKKGPPKA